MARIRPYLVRATYDWIVEHEMTPYVLIDAEDPESEVPFEYIDNGKIVLNVSPVAVQNLQLNDDYIGFEASFSGEAWQIFAPTRAVLAMYASETGQGVYARESGLGMLVNEGEAPDLDPLGDDDDAPKSSGLRLVK